MTLKQWEREHNRIAFSYGKGLKWLPDSPGIRGIRSSLWALDDYVAITDYSADHTVIRLVPNSKAGSKAD